MQTSAKWDMPTAWTEGSPSDCRNTLSEEGVLPWDGQASERRGKDAPGGRASVESGGTCVCDT